MSAESDTTHGGGRALLQNSWVRYVLALAVAFAGFALGYWGLGLQSNHAIFTGLLFQWACDFALHRTSPLPDVPEENRVQGFEIILLIAAMAIFVLLAFAVLRFFSHSY